MKALVFDVNVNEIIHLIQDARENKKGQGVVCVRRVAPCLRRYGSNHQRVSSSSIASNGSARTRSLPPCVLATTQRPFSSR
jgi:hypothetical protein